jgi:hypothetical protein
LSKTDPGRELGIVPFEHDMLRALLGILGAKHKSEYYSIKNKVEEYLRMLRTFKKERKKTILSLGLELESHNLKNEITRIMSRMHSNMHAFSEFSKGDNSEDCFALLALSIFRDDPNLYSSDIHDRYLEF